MTPLKKTVVREATRTSDGGRPIVVTLEPGDVIGFRLKGCRKVFRTTLAACYSMAVKQEVREQKKQKGKRK